MLGHITNRVEDAADPYMARGVIRMALASKSPDSAGGVVLAMERKVGSSVAISGYSEFGLDFNRLPGHLPDRIITARLPYLNKASCGRASYLALLQSNSPSRVAHPSSGLACTFRLSEADSFNPFSNLSKQRTQCKTSTKLQHEKLPLLSIEPSWASRSSRAKTY